MRPYYEHDGVTIYHGDCREVIPVVGAPASLLLTDPPYGVSWNPQRSGFNPSRKAGGWNRWARDQEFAPIAGDDKPVDAAWLLTLAPKTAIFGGNYVADQLPASACWIVWNKRDGVSPNDQADCELVWTNFGRPARIYDHLWSGLLRAGEENVARGPKLHPHQKPVDLLRRIALYSDTTGCILDPYMGCGSTLRAAKDLGRPAVGIEIEERYCEVAARRLDQHVLDFGAA